MAEPFPTGGAPRAAGRPCVVVLGGRGFVGRSASLALIEAGYDVTVVGRRSDDLPAGCSFQALDVVQAAPDELSAMLAALSPAAVVNSAGTYWAVGNRRPSDAELVAGNLSLVEKLVEAVAVLPGRPRLVHMGTTYEYGPQPQDTLLTEQTPEQPVNQYGLTKLAATRLVRDAAAAGRIDAVTLRLTTTIGPWPPRTSLFGRIAYGLASAPQRLELPSVQDERDFVDVRDVAGAVVAAIGADAPQPLFNVASGTIVPVADAVDLLIKIADQPTAITWQARETSSKDASAIRSQRIDIGAARERLGWEPRHTLADSMAALWASVQDA